MDEPEPQLFPYVTTPARVALDVVDALARCPAVSRVVLFGSLASGRHDGWSDVDALCAVEGDDGPWQAAAALREAMPLRWHGVFHDVPPPSGRHWLLGESLFHSIDLTFDSPAGLERRLRDGLPGGATEWRVVLDRAGRASPGRPAALPALSDEYDFTHAIHAATKALKGYLRAAAAWDAVVSAMRDVETAGRTVRVVPGADPGDVLKEARTLYYSLMQERARYGGEE